MTRQLENQKSAVPQNTQKFSNVGDNHLAGRLVLQYEAAVNEIKVVVGKKLQIPPNIDSELAIKAEFPGPANHRFRDVNTKALLEVGSNRARKPSHAATEVQRTNKPRRQFQPFGFVHHIADFFLSSLEEFLKVPAPETLLWIRKNGP